MYKATKIQHETDGERKKPRKGEEGTRYERVQTGEEKAQEWRVGRIELKGGDRVVATLFVIVVILLLQG
jgi:hypothetical protein